MPTPEEKVHWSDWASQPDVQIACGGTTTPLWNDPWEPPQGCYWAEPRDGIDKMEILYTFNDDPDVVKCPACLEKLRAHLAEQEAEEAAPVEEVTRG